jgi:hypothetical protein
VQIQATAPEGGRIARRLSSPRARHGARGAVAGVRSGLTSNRGPVAPTCAAPNTTAQAPASPRRCLRAAQAFLGVRERLAPACPRAILPAPAG